MQYDFRKAYAYPVLRKGSSDYPSDTFSLHLNVERILKSTEIELTAEFELTNEYLISLIDQGKAKFALLAKSPITFFRTAIVGTRLKIQHHFESGQLAGNVSFNPFLVATLAINDFASDTWHKDFSGMKFDIQLGSVLAVGEPYHVYIDMAEESSVASIFRLGEDSTLEDGLWNCEFNPEEEQVVINLSASEWNRVNSVRVNVDTGDANERLLNGLYFPALVWLLQELDSMATKNETSDFSELKWYRSLERKLEDMNCNKLGKGKDRLEDAQKIFEYPFPKLLLHENGSVSKD